PNEFTEVGAPLDIIVLEIDKENRRLSLGHKQIEENPWNAFEANFRVGSIHEGTVSEIVEKGAVIALPEGIEAFATPKHLVKADGTQAVKGEVLPFKVIEFNKDARRIIVSHSRTFEDEAKAEARAGERAERQQRHQDASAAVAATNAATEKATLGDLDALAALKEKLS
ncbi:MAG: S1 RNA-binding domain-containing protein, partial [Porphyromonadaceae bacterium]|nr:S1 RNA-binding domain-containing protein [Porphyromonadaceae bacterium]